MIKAFDYLRYYETHRLELLAAVERVLCSGQLLLGPELQAFEAEFATFVGAEHGVGVASGTDALELALLAVGVGRDDEVITVANTAVPTAAAIRAVGALPRFVDIDPDTLNIDIQAVLPAVTPKTRAIIPVHLHGTPIDLMELKDLVQDRNIRIIEDCAHAHGASVQGVHSGLTGDVGCFSFYPTKNLGAFGDGGICVTNHAAVASRLRSLRMYGFQGDRIAHCDGRNSRLDEIQAAILRTRLAHLPSLLARRNAIAQRYRKGLEASSVVLPPQIAGTQSAWHQFVIRTPRRAAVISALNARHIGWGIHYETPLHQMPAYRLFHIGRPALPQTEIAAREILSLPIYPELRDEEIDQVVKAVKIGLSCGENQ